MTKIICDRCGQEIKEKPRYIAFGIKNSAKSPEIFCPYEFCEKCIERIKAIIIDTTIDPTRITIELTAGPTESSPLAAGSTAKKAGKRNTHIDMGKVNALREAGWSIGKIAEEIHIPPEDIAEKIFDRKVQEQESAKTR